MMVTALDQFAPRRGDDCSFAAPVQNADGTYASLKGAVMRFTYGHTSDGPPLKTKEIGDGITLGTIKINGVDVDAFVVAFPGAETAGLEAYRIYRFQGRVTFPAESGQGPETVLTGSFPVNPEQG